MWVVDINGKGLDLNSGHSLTWVQKEPGSEDYGVVLVSGNLFKCILDCNYSSFFFVGTSLDCKDYIAALVDKLNAPVIDMSEINASIYNACIEIVRAVREIR